MPSSSAIEVQQVSFRYPQRLALDAVSLEIASGEIFALLGPNGGGKTTLFRLLSTLIPLQEGEVRILGRCITADTADVRRRIGVVFQAPSVDKKLSVRENVRHQGMLYGLSGGVLNDRCHQMLEQLGLADRAEDRVETLSGGLRRRVELAKGLLHRPQVLLMDEPSTGLDPAARGDLWTYLRRIRDEQGVTVVLTTHLLEEADRADRIGILHQGRLVALDSPQRLRASLGGDSISIETDQQELLTGGIAEHFGLQVQTVDGSLRLQPSENTAQPGAVLVQQIAQAYGDQIRSITLGKPTLEDVFIDRTGHRFWHSRAEDADG